LVATPSGKASGGGVGDIRERHPWGGDGDRVKQLVGTVRPPLAETRPEAVTGELAEDAGLGDRVVGTQGQEGPEMVFPGVDPVRGEQQPVRGAPLAVFRYAVLSITPERPLGGQAVPNTGVRNLCSIDRSRGHFSGCRSGSRG
jgi:hypothetical protein